MSLFGNTNSNPPAGGSLFGAKPAGSTGTSLFGQPAGGAAGAGQQATGGLFGASTNKSTAGTGGGLFGGTTTNTGGGLFGSGASSTAPATTTSGGGLFGGGGAAASGTSTPSLFGGAASNTSNTAPAAGTTPSLFGAPKPADSNAAAAKPASSFFGQPATTGGTSTTGGGLFGNTVAKPADSTTTTSATPAPTGSLFGAKPAASTSSTTPASGFTLGGNKDTSSTTSTATPAPTGGLFGAKPAEKKDGAPAPAPSFNLFGGAKADDKKDAPAAGKEGDKSAAAAPASTTSSTTAVVAVPPPSMLRGKTIEEIVNRWTSELETHVKDFSRFASEVAVWDRALVENGNNLAALYNHVLAAERQQTEIDSTLDNVEQHQKELLDHLEQYEKLSADILGSQGGAARALDTGPADTERDRNYMLASDLHTNLDDLSTSLTQMIESVNALSIAQKSSGEGQDDPMAQISQVLSSHLESLQWIDSAVRDVGSKVNEVEKRVKESGQPYGNGSRRGGFGLNR
ncbi:nuclear pore glycoprotein p62 [Coprinopsis cinerea okayama7|uniref:Nuclear pore glycoprotein p62 n=1 Tax=Coprinopsis cinerea (strain Okayama-7 / 130 / ATCC MYA-4618 / FGSC 9003) TaxID=240176 RepID=A8NXX4_COPC7|nr:nuclear pore glycoprotein p62 [Coprinopsis cinerea okayama7\|eukprot:XP_001837295.1 nuclear pore glycoprotein p62 [Coprinopsis cinerea okayama7\